MEGFIRVAKSKVAENLVTIFLSDQYNKKVNKKISSDSEPINKAAVLGAGIMGGGIAYQSASRNKPVLAEERHK